MFSNKRSGLIIISVQDISRDILYLSESLGRMLGEGTSSINNGVDGWKTNAFGSELR